ncbi:MAG: type 4a pilus biogenesis protein PilO [Candidatus Paceibacterota bacterium]|jgi:Tfp pilus assembly protein PilO
MPKLIFAILCLIISAILVFSAGGAVLNGGSNSVWAFLLGDNTVGIKDLLAQRTNLNQTLADINGIKAKILELQQIKNSISKTDLDKLDKFIPNHVDNVNLIIDINNIAAKQGMTLKNVRVQSTAGSSGSKVTSPSGIQPTFMSFSVTGNYQTLMKFLDGLANSLRVVDPASLSFAVDEKGLNQYNFEIKTYWVK